MSKKNNHRNKNEMHKEKEIEILNLMKSIKKSVPKKICVENYKERIINHGYHTVKFLKKLSSEHRLYNWALSNVKGELYEAFISEVLLDWARNNNDVNNFILKDPYVKTNEVENGFGYDRRRITLYGDSDPLAEFDAMFKYKRKLFFVEITTTTKRENIKKFLQNIARKRKILKLVFNSEDVYSLIITIVPNLFNPSDLSIYDLNYYFPIDEELLTLIPEITTKGRIIKFVDKNSKFIFANELEYHELEYKKKRTYVRRQFNKYYKGKITSEEFIQKTQDVFGIVQNFSLGVLPNTALNVFLENGLLYKKYTGFNINRIRRIVVGVKLELGKTAQLRLYVIPSRFYSDFIYTFYWKNNQFKIRDKVLKKSCFLKTFDPKFDPNDKSLWEQLGNACINLKIPKID